MGGRVHDGKQLEVFRLYWYLSGRETEEGFREGTVSGRESKGLPGQVENRLLGLHDYPAHEARQEMVEAIRAIQKGSAEACR